VSTEALATEVYSEVYLAGDSPRLRAYRLLAAGRTQAQTAKALGLSKQAVHKMKERLVRDRWLTEAEPRSYPRFYTRGPQGPAYMGSPRHGVARDGPLPPGCRLRYHNAAFGFSVEPPVPPPTGWRAWRAGKGGSTAMATTRVGDCTLVLRGGTRQPTLVVHLPPEYAYSAEELVGVAHEAPRRARDVAARVAAAAGIRLRPGPAFSTQTPEVALEDPNGYVGAFWADRSKGFHEWETGALLLGYWAAKALEERRLLFKSHPDAAGVDLESHRDETPRGVSL
jgi:hypothetical protein